MKRSHRLPLARALLLGLVGLVVLTVGATAWQGWRSGQRARLLRHQLVAERIFDSMERELTTLLDDEESRPFVQYRPMEGLMGPRPEYVLGWFQVDPEGSFAVAHEMSAQEEAELKQVADGLSGWGQVDAKSPETVTVRVPVDVPAAKMPTKSRKKMPVKAPISVGKSNVNTNPKLNNPVDNLPITELPPEAFLGNAAVQRADRTEQTQAVNRMQIQQFVQPAEPPPQAQAAVQALAPSEPEVEQAVQAAAPGPRRIWVPVQVEVPDSAEVVDVVLSPMRIQSGEGGDTLVLSRTVSLEGRSWVQGLVVNVAALQAYLVHASLADTGFETSVSVSWIGEAETIDGYLFEHGFATPFEAFVATTHITPLPEADGGVEVLIWVSSLLLLVLAAAGLFAVYRLLLLSVRHAEQRDDFVSAVTHELKSPLTSIRMYSEMLEAGMVTDSEQQQGYYATIRQEAERLSRLVDDVLAFSRIDRGLPVAAGETGRLAAVVQDVTRLLQPQFEAGGATLLVQIEPSVEDLAVDRDALSQVLTNLLDNALKFSRDAEDQRISLNIRQVGERATLIVRDRGPGVPPALLRTMFEPFVRGERELTRRTKGTGIGLTLVRQLIDHLGGSVEAHNHPEGGLEVAVILPVA